jgi:hypothetical protein
MQFRSYYAKPRILGPDTLCNLAIYTLNDSGQHIPLRWDLPSGFSTFSSCSTSITIRADILDGRQGKLIVIINDTISLEKTIYACNVPLSGPFIIGQSACTTAYTVSNLPSSGISNDYWTCGSGITQIGTGDKNGASFRRSQTVPSGGYPLYDSIHFHFDYNGKSYKISKQVQIIPATSGYIVDYWTTEAVFSGRVGRLYYFSANAPQSGYPAAVRWTVTPTMGMYPLPTVYNYYDTYAYPIEFDEEGYYNIKLEVQDACGWVTVKEQNFWVFDFSPFGFEYSYYPNPVNDELTIEFEVNRLLSARSQQPADPVCKITLFDKNGNEVRQHIWNSKQSSKQVHINTRNLPKGTYYLHFENNGEIKKEQIIVQ